VDNYPDDITSTDPASPLHNDGGEADYEDVLYCQIMDSLDCVAGIDAAELGDIVIDLWPDTQAVLVKLADYIKAAVNDQCSADINEMRK